MKQAQGRAWQHSEQCKPSLATPRFRRIRWIAAIAPVATVRKASVGEGRHAYRGHPSELSSQTYA